MLCHSNKCKCTGFLIYYFLKFCYPPRLTQAGHTLQVETSSFLWGEQVHLFSYSRIESESTTTLGTKATNTRLKQQTFQPTETKKSLNLYFITLGAFHSPSGQGVAWFKEQGKKIPFENTFTIVTLPLIHLVHHDPLFPISLGEGGGGGGSEGELNKTFG